MKIESPYKTATIMTLSSILLIIIGYPLFYIFSSGRFHILLVENTILVTLKLLVQPAGFLIFLLTFTMRPRNPLESTKLLFIISSIHIFLGTLINTASSLAFIGGHGNTLQLVFHVIMLSSIFLSGLCLSIFVFIQSKGTLQLKKLSKTIVVLTLILLLSTAIYLLAYRYWPIEHVLYCIVSILPNLGYFAYLAAVIVFFISIDKIRSQTS